GRVCALLDGDERRNRLAFDLVRAPDARRLGDARVVDQCALDLHRPDAMACHVDHVVDAAEQPVISLAVALRAVARHVYIRSPLVPVLPNVPIRIAVDAAQHRWPRTGPREQAAADVDLVAALGPDLSGDPG